jgi:Rod binding domain-containing protein
MMTNASPISSAAALSGQLATPSPSLGRGKNAAREFEAHLIGSLLESLEKTFSSVPGGQSSPGADDYNYIGTEALAGALAEKGGFGIAAMITKYMAAHQSTDRR